MSRANSLKKAVRQIIEHAEKALDEQNGIQASRSTHSASASQTSGCGATGSGNDIKLIVTHPEDPSSTTIKSSSCNPAIKSAALPMAFLQLYSAMSGTGGDSSSEPSPCPSPIPVAPSLTTNFPLLPTSPIRYPNPPVFYRMATPPNIQPQRPRSNSEAPLRATSPRPPGPYVVSHQESAESEGDEDRSAMLSLQVIILIWNVFILFCLVLKNDLFFNRRNSTPFLLCRTRLKRERLASLISQLWLCPFHSNSPTRTVCKTYRSMSLTKMPTLAKIYPVI